MLRCNLADDQHCYLLQQLHRPLVPILRQVKQNAMESHSEYLNVCFFLGKTTFPIKSVTIGYPVRMFQLNFIAGDMSPIPSVRIPARK